MNVLTGFDSNRAASFGVTDYVSRRIPGGPLSVGSGEILTGREHGLAVLDTAATAFSSNSSSGGYPHVTTARIEEAEQLSPKIFDLPCPAIRNRIENYRLMTIPPESKLFQ
jgi:hypothetical protein